MDGGPAGNGFESSVRIRFFEFCLAGFAPLSGAKLLCDCLSSPCKNSLVITRFGVGAGFDRQGVLSVPGDLSSAKGRRRCVSRSTAGKYRDYRNMAT